MPAKTPKTMWTLISSEKNRKTLSWLGAGLLVIIGGIWTWYTYLDARSRESKAPAPQTQVGSGGINIGRDNINSPLSTNAVPK